MGNESLYHMGPYRLTPFDPRNQRVYEKDYSYWDADNVHLEKVTATYNAEASTLAPELFNRGGIDLEGINNTGGSFKYYHLLAEPLTVEQYNQIYADWQVAREESLK